MAYVGSDQAITQLEAGKASFSLAGYLSFLLWRSVYITKQVKPQCCCVWFVQFSVHVIPGIPSCCVAGCDSPLLPVGRSARATGS